jgi:putative hydrolase of the HAD superfamily
MTQNKIKLVGFDLDDCLFDSTGLSERARIKGIEAMIKLGLKINRNEAIDLIKEIVNEYGSNFSKHYNFFIRRLNEIRNYHISSYDKYKYIAGAVIAYHQEKIESIKLYKDVKPCLEELRDMNIKTAIISDGIPIKQYEKILRLNIEELIDFVVISDEIGMKKPNPKIFAYCLKKFGINGDETIYIGDRVDKDVIPAHLNNMNTVYIHRGGKYNNFKLKDGYLDEITLNYEISSLDEIFAIINKINRK